MLAKPGTIDFSWITRAEKCESQEVTDHALSILREHQPDVMFVHLPSVDNVGHSKGWGTPEQMEAITRTDACVGQILSELDELKLSEQTLVILTSDHGGAGRTHGPDDPRSRTIPWIARGPGVRKNFDLTRLSDLDIETYDTFATSCGVLGIPIERRIRGKFIAEIFEDRELVKPTTAPVAVPSTTPTTPATQATR
jgi:phosphopentomutase